MSAPSVSVVIPSVGRPTITRAIRSVLAQDYAGPIDLVVAFDTPESAEIASVLGEHLEQVTVVWTGGGKRGAAARNLGVAAARGEFVAFLDDDDEWLPSKLSAQVDALPADSATVVSSSRVVQVDPVRGRQSVPLPATLIRPVEPVESFLFLRRRASITRAAIYTSTLLVPRALAERVGWDESLTRHQDWDWLMRLQREGGATIVQVPTADVRIWMNSAGSISGSSDWRASIAWIESWRGRVGEPVIADFIAAQCLRYALQAGSREGVTVCVRALRRTGSRAHLGPLIVGLSGLAPRALLARLLLRAAPQGS
jgi:glycosyltransferase involved in cell wall biosynthesis